MSSLSNTSRLVCQLDVRPTELCCTTYLWICIQLDSVTGLDQPYTFFRICIHNKPYFKGTHLNQIKMLMGEHKITLSDLLYLLYLSFPAIMQAWTCTIMCACVWVFEVCLQGSVGDTNKSQRDFGPKRHKAMGPVTSEVPTWMTEPMGGHHHQLSLPAAHR